MGKKRLERLAIHLVLVAGGMLMVFPFLWMVSTSLKYPDEVFSYPPRWFPSKPNWGNYINAWNSAPFGRFFLNSVLTSGAVTLAQLVTCSTAAFAFARMRFPGREALFVAFLGTMMIPHQVTMIPNYIILSKLGWIDTYYALIVPFTAGAFGIFLLRQFFLTIPKELEDAATIDGCSYLRFLVSIMLPLSRPALSALALFTFMREWNSYTWPLIVTNSTNMRTLQVGLRFFISQEGGNLGHLLMAASMIATVPVLIVFFLAQEQLIEAMTATGLKG